MKNYSLKILILFFLINSCSQDDEINSLNDRVLSLQQNISELNNKINEYIIEVNQLQSENSSLNNEISALQNQNNSLLIQNINLQDEINSLTNQNSSLQDEINSLTNQNSSLQDEINSLTNQKSSLQDEIDALLSKDIVNQEQINSLTAEKNNLQEQINSLTAEKNNLQEQVNSLTAEKNNLQEQVNSLTAENQSLNQQIQTYIEQLNVITDSHDQLQTLNENLDNEVLDLTSQNEVLNNQLISLNVQLSDLQLQILNYTQQIEELSGSNQILEDEKIDLINQLNQLQAELDDLQSQTADNGLYIFNQIEFTAPPFYGTAWDLPNFITSSDFTVYSSSTYNGIETRLFYDMSIPDFEVYPAHIYNVNFGDGVSVEFEIKTDFSIEEAANIEKKYSPMLGQLGKELRKNIKTMEFLKGEYVASAQYSDDLTYANITFHTDWFENIVETRPDGDKTEEIFIHEAAHLSIDPYLYGQEGWENAINLDGNYLSTYASNNPNTEDIAETFPAYIAVKYFSDRISNGLRDTILSISLNRFKYFDSLNLDLSIYK